MDALFLCLLAWCGVFDIQKRTVPNNSVLLLLCLGLAHMGHILLCGGVWWQYPAGLSLAIPFFIAWLKNSIGAGDVKLIGGIGLYLGVWYGLLSLILMLPVLVVISLYFLIKRKIQKQRIPFAPVLLLGSVSAIALSYLFTI
jgi:leader peptidase (prepilin peptidase) / N-methyltransferase